MPSLSNGPSLDTGTIRERRYGRTAPLDVWNTHSCHLPPDKNVRDKLAAFCTAGLNEEKPHGPASYLVREPEYAPFESPQIPHPETGVKKCQQFLDLISSPDFIAAVKATSPAASLAMLAASKRAGLWGRTSTTRALDTLIAVTPAKGRETDDLVPVYHSRHAESIPDAAAMVTRDFFSSWYFFCYLYGDPQELDVCGAILCLSTLVDYVGRGDESWSGGEPAHLDAASEGIACLGGKAYDVGLEELAIFGALTRAKSEFAAASHVANPKKFVEDCGGPATPHEYMLTRWWDGAYHGLQRITWGTKSYQHLSDSNGSLTGTSCGRIQRALDHGIRYNDLNDLLPDYAAGKYCNEPLLALAIAGSDAILGYGDACSRVTDDLLECTCGADGHQEAAEYAMGNCLYYVLQPRYRLRLRLAALSGSASQIAADFAPPTAGTRLRSVATTILEPGHVLHSPQWHPLWRQTASSRGSTAEWAAALARRVVRRSLVDSGAGLPDRGRGDAIDQCQAVARSVLVECDRRTERTALRALSQQWGELFDVVQTTWTAGTHPQYRECANELRQVIGRVWEHSVVGGVTPETDNDQRLIFDTDHAVRRSHLLPPSAGYHLRRNFFGVLTSAIDLSGFNPFSRMSDGIARTTMNNPPEERQTHDRGQ